MCSRKLKKINTYSVYRTIHYMMWGKYTKNGIISTDIHLPSTDGACIRVMGQ